MPQGLGNEYYSILNTTIESKTAKGLFVRDLRLLAEFHITRNNLDIPFASSIFSPLTEMFLVAKNIPHTFSRNREGVFISGIGFKKSEARELVETLTLGIGRAAETAEEAERLYAIVFNLTNNPESPAAETQ